MYAVQGMMYAVQCVLHSVYCTVYAAQGTLYGAHFIHIEHSTLDKRTKIQTKKLKNSKMLDFLKRL